MKGDFSRFTFNSEKRYSRVLMQQGRVQLDADWNEQLDISAYRTETEITDFIGQSGTPENHAGFAISVIEDGKNLGISQGRFYIKGMLFENHSAGATLTSQPDFPNDKIEDFLAAGGPDGHYLAYLDVWQRHITALEDASIREVALGGADTTTRVKNVWQVKLKRLEEIDGWNAESSLESLGKPESLPKWEPTWEHAISQGRLKASVSQQSGTALENQLYRVEVHQGTEVLPSNSPKPVSFKWSRENGAIAFQVESVDDIKIQIKQLGGRDLSTAFVNGQLIEYTDETIALRGEPGYLARVIDIQGNILTVKWLDETQKPVLPLRAAPIVRLWDALWVSPQDASTPETSRIQIENGIEVELQPKQYYKTGDYWLIPSRHLKGGIEWKLDQSNHNQAAFQLPHGTLHHYCALALVKKTGGKFLNDITLKDYRFIFKPIASGLVSKAGDTITGSLAIDKNLLVDGNVGIGTRSPQSLLSIAGGVAIGARYASQSAGPNGLLVEGNVGVGTVEPGSQLSVTRGVAIGARYASYSNTLDGSLLVEGNVGIGTPSPKSKLSVSGGAAIGSTYSFQNPAPESGLIVEGNVGIGTTDPKSMLSVSGGVAIGSDYTSSNPSPTDGLIVKGNVGIGNTNPQSKLVISGDAATASIETREIIRLVRPGAEARARYGYNGQPISFQKFQSAGFCLGTFEQNLNGKSRLDIKLSGSPNDTNQQGEIPDTAIMTLQGDKTVGIGTSLPKSTLSVAGGVAIGLDYASSNPSPTDGLIVKGNVGIGTRDPQAKLEINGNVNINGSAASLVVAGNIGHWTISPVSSLYFDSTMTLIKIYITIKQGSYNNLIPIYSSTEIAYIQVTTEETDKEWIAVYQSLRNNQPSPQYPLAKMSSSEFSSDVENISKYILVAVYRAASI